MCYCGECNLIGLHHHSQGLIQSNKTCCCYWEQ